MAKFVFSMQNLLNMKEKIEEQTKNEYSQAVLRLQEAEDERDALIQKQKEYEEKLRVKISARLNLLDIKRLEEGVEIIKVHVKQANLDVLQRENEVEQVREKLKEAMRERKTFEKLRENAFEAFMKEENAKEQKEIDELVSYKYGSQIVNEQ